MPKPEEGAGAIGGSLSVEELKTLSDLLARVGLQGAHDKQRPRLSMFSGGAGKDSTSYDVWSHEVKCLQREGVHSEENILECIRRNVKGEAARVVMRLGVEASVDDILSKMDSLYGVVQQEGVLLSTFYSAQQKEDESVSEWCCRLESLVTDMQVSDQKMADEMVRSKLWTGLFSQELRAATRHKFDTVKELKDLLVAMRVAEMELQPARAKKTVKASSHVAATTTSPAGATAAPVSSSVEELLLKLDGRLTKIEEEIGQLKRRRSDGRKTDDGEKSEWKPPKCFACGNIGHIAKFCCVKENEKSSAPRSEQ